MPKLGWLRFHDTREFSQKIKRATLKKTKSHRYFLSLTLEAQEDVKKLRVVNEKAIIAFDMSATHFLVNDIVKMENPRFYRSEERKTKKLNKTLLRKKKGSQNQEKSRLQLVRHYAMICNRKKDWTHKITQKLADIFDAIILENLSI